ncbi:MAG: hypothetical protein HYR71_05960 [Chloroflexi bacterium]|nr:hypothetical protein [Chloroflexota bacterium]
MDNDWPGVLAALEGIRRALIARRAMLWNVTLDETSWAQFAPRLAQLQAALPDAAVEAAPWSPPLSALDEGLTMPSPVNYVAKGEDIRRLGYEPRGSISVMTNYLRMNWVHERVRVQGGAYGGGCSFDRQSGVFSFSSYRDPNLLRTIESYDGSAQFLREAHIGDDELTKNIIGVVGQLDFYQLPDAKGYTSMLRHLLGETDETLQQWRDEVLSTTAADIKGYADWLEQVERQGKVVVLGSPEAIDAANAARGGWLRVTPVMAGR